MSAFVKAQEEFTVPGLKYPHQLVPGMELSGEGFIPEKHLQLEPPTHIKNLNFEDVPFPYSNEQSNIRCNLAYSRPFRVLSDEGIRLARETVMQHKDRLGKGDDRSAFYVRGLGMVSNFHKDLSYCDELRNFLSSIARDTLYPSTIMNISHTNIGQIGAGKPIDKWHVDSVDYVMVLILSDLRDMVGGELRVLQLPDSSGSVFDKMKEEGVPEDLIETVQYTGAGYAILMQGSKILHSVREVISAREPRMSLVNSYITTRVFAPCKTKYNLFRNVDGPQYINYEYACHKAWRACGQLGYLIEKSSYETPSDELSVLLRNAASELLWAADLIDGKACDNPKFIDLDENVEKVEKIVDDNDNNTPV